MKSCPKKQEEIRKFFDLQEVQHQAWCLNEFEKTTSYDRFHAGALYCAERLKEAGFSDVEVLEHPADGKTTFGECTMPRAWDITGRSTLEIVKSKEPDLLDCEKLLADTDETSIAAVPWSTATPQNGITGEIVELDSLAGDYSRVKGKWILYVLGRAYKDKRGIAHIIQDLAAGGAAGVAMTSYRVEASSPTGTIWFNGQGCNGWYPTIDDKRLPIFAITPLRARLLERLLAKGPVEVKGIMNCRTYDGSIATVTATIPGKSEEEFAIFAHLYEPFISDDAQGVALSMALGKNLLLRKVKPAKTLRLVFSMELYGFNAYLEEEKRRKKILAALSLDTYTLLQKTSCLYWRLSPRFCGCFTDILFREAFAANFPELLIREDPGSLSDDTFAGTPQFNIPTNWLHGYGGDGHHHNTGPFFMPDWELVGRTFPLVIELVEQLLTGKGLEDISQSVIKEFKEEIRKIGKANLSPSRKLANISSFHLWEKTRLLSLERWGVKINGMEALELLYQKALAKLEKEKAKTPERFSKAEKEAGQLLVTLLTETAPFSLAKIPFAEKRPGIPDKALYALFDGKRTLLEALRFMEAQTGVLYSNEMVSRILEEVKYFARYGYLKLEKLG